MLREEEIIWEDQPFLVKFDYTPGHPGKTSGPPDRCYPPEGPEYGITSVELYDPCSGAKWNLTEWMRSAVDGSLIEALSDLLYEQDEEQGFVEDEPEEEEDDQD